MVGSQNPYFVFFHCKLKRNYLAFAWIVGLLLGAVLSVSADKLLASTMHAAISGSMSISGLIAVVLLPLLLSAYAVYFSQPAWLLLIIFLKAFLFAYTGAAILILYPTSGWLIGCLMMFSDALILPFLWWFWLFSASAPREQVLRRTAACAIWFLLIGCVDFAVVAPFLAHLI